MYIPSAYWRMKAREALKGSWLTALLIALVVNLPSLLVEGIASVTGNDLMQRMADLLYGSMTVSGSAASVDAAALARGLQELRDSAGVWIFQGLRAAAWLLTPCLTLGMVHWMLQRLRKQEAGDVTAVFSRMGLFFKGIGLRLYVLWRVFVWMLPGIALNVLAFLPLWLSDRNSTLSILSAANTTRGLQSAAMIATAVLGAVGWFRYVLGDMVLADNPATGPVRAAKESKRLTERKLGSVFSLYLSFLLWIMVRMMVGSLAAGMMGPIIGLMVDMLAGLAITVYLNTSVCAFYLGCRAAEKIAAAGQEKEKEETEEEMEI